MQEAPMLTTPIVLAAWVLSLAFGGAGAQWKWQETQANQTAKESEDRMLQATTQEMEAAMNLAARGCRPLFDDKGVPYDFIPSGYHVRQDTAIESIPDGSTVCTRKGEVAIVRNGKIGPKRTVGYVNQAEYLQIYESYLSKERIR